MTYFSGSRNFAKLAEVRKIVRHAGKLIMKVPRATFERLQFDRLFAACQLAPVMTG